MGPRARDVLATVCGDDLAFRYMQGRSITVGDVPCWASRVTYVGELGWELYPPAEYGLRLWETLIGAGAPFGLLPGGYRAIDSLRLGKGYRVWRADISGETDPYSAGLGFAVRDDKDFNGKGALPDRGVTLTVEVFGELVAATVTAEPLLDPGGDRVRA